MPDKEFEQVVSEIMLINKRYSDKDHLKSLNGDTLSYTGVRLAALKAYIIEVKVDAHRAFLDAETEYKAVKARTLRRLVGEPIKEGGAKISATAAGELLYGEKEVIDAANDKSAKETFYNRLKSLSADTHDTIDAIKSRVIDMQGARKDERLG